MSQSLKIDFNDNYEPHEVFISFEKIITDRRSVYSVSIGRVRSRDDIKKFLHQTKSQNNHDKATHHSWAVRLSHDGAIYESKNDDGETGAGQVILRILQKQHMINTIVCVTRWFGGIKLESDRFKHIQDATLYAIRHVKML
ncbi:MAG: YigZ family protein [Candidatus Pacebacteria bacterium]|nr:YigZ family protein [Candidatus Paceibacterota bacterium]